MESLLSFHLYVHSGAPTQVNPLAQHALGPLSHFTIIPFPEYIFNFLSLYISFQLPDISGFYTPGLLCVFFFLCILTSRKKNE